MATTDVKLQELQEAMNKMSVKMSRMEETLISPQERFSHSYFSEMTRSLSMPGMRFIGKKFQHGVHTYLWLFIHMVALLISYAYIKEEYDNWQTSPVIRTLSNNSTFVREIPFPAITICVPFSRSGNYDYFSNLEKCITCHSTEGRGQSCFFNSNCNETEQETLAVATLMCPSFKGTRHVSESPVSIFSRQINKSIDSELYETYAKKVLPPCDYTIKQRSRVNKEYVLGCDKNGFQYFLAFGPYGSCTTFNGLRHEDIYKESTVPTVPLQQHSFDRNYIGDGFTSENMMYFNGGNESVPVYFTQDDYFEFIISRRQNMYIDPCYFFKGNDMARIILHNPAEIPLLSDIEYTITTDSYHYLKVIPKLETTKKDLIKYSPVQRGCFYSHERELMLFKRYSESSCEVECMVNCSIENCNCIPHYLPRPNISHRICFLNCEARCDCGCLPDCTSLSYDYKSSKETINTNLVGIFYVYYKNNHFYPMIRVGISDLADFMAYSFGILGTFNGFSIMVILELIYFITIRLWCSISAYLEYNFE